MHPDRPRSQLIAIARYQDAWPMADELLPKVDLFRISDPMLEVLTSLVRQAVRQEMAAAAPAGALRAADAARYLGLGRSKFYAMLKADPELMGASFCVGT